jgi:hypothetical protein
MPRFSPPLARMRSCTSWSGSPAASAGSTSTVTRSGTGSPSPRAIAAQITSATSTFGPCPAPWNFTT